MNSPKTPGTPPYIEPERFARLGHDPQPHQPKDVWQFNVLDFVPHVNPANYYCTSGEAVTKAKKLEQDLWKAAAAARRFYNLMVKARAKHKYLELEITGMRTNDNCPVSLCKCKDPRPNMRLMAKHQSHQPHQPQRHF